MSAPTPRAHQVETLETMLARGIKSTATQGGEGAKWRETAAHTPDGEVNR